MGQIRSSGGGCGLMAGWSGQNSPGKSRAWRNAFTSIPTLLPTLTATLFPFLHFSDRKSHSGVQPGEEYLPVCDWFLES